MKHRYFQTAGGVYTTLMMRKRKALVRVSREDFARWYDDEPKRCHYCGTSAEDACLSADKLNRRCYRLSVDRVDNAKGYELGNMVLACARCNNIKGDFFTASEMLEIGRRYVAPRWAQTRT